MAKRPQSSLIWPEGRPRPLPTEDRELMRRLLQNPETTFGGPWLEWLKGRLELEPPQFVGADLPASSPQKIIEDSEVVVGQEPALSFDDASITLYNTIVEFDVTNTPGVRDIVKGRVATRVFNPGDVLVDPSLYACVSLGAGYFTTARTTISGSGSYQEFEGSTANSVGTMGNLAAGFGLEVRFISTETLSALANNFRMTVRGYKDGIPTDDIADGAAFLDYGWMGTNYYDPESLIDSGWKTMLSPNDLAGIPISYSDYCDEILLGCWALTSSMAFGSVIPAGRLYYRWYYDPNSEGRNVLADLPYPASDTVENLIHWDPATGQWVVDTDVLAVARGRYRANGGTSYERQRLNVIPGSSQLSVAMADDSANEEVDLTIDVVEANIGITDLGSFPGGSTTFLRADATWAVADLGAEKGRMVAYFNGTPVAGTSRYVVIPRNKGDADATIDLERLHFRLDIPASSGTTTAILQKSAGGSVPAWSDVATISITSGNYEATDQTIGAYTVTADDLLRLYFTAVGTGADGYTAIVTGTEV